MSGYFKDGTTVGTSGYNQREAEVSDNGDGSIDLTIDGGCFDDYMNAEITCLQALTIAGMLIRAVQEIATRELLSSDGGPQHDD